MIANGSGPEAFRKPLSVSTWAELNRDLQAEVEKLKADQEAIGLRVEQLEGRVRQLALDILLGGGGA
jgi:hypothetical protein